MQFVPRVLANIFMLKALNNSRSNSLPKNVSTQIKILTFARKL